MVPTGGVQGQWLVENHNYAEESDQSPMLGDRQENSVNQDRRRDIHKGTDDRE